MAAGEEVIFLEEEEKQSSRRKVIRKEVNQGTRFSNPPAHITDELSITIQPNTPSHCCTNHDDEWLNSLEKMGSPDTTVPAGPPKIQRVPPMLRDIESNKKCYDPLVVSIGPLHYGKQGLAPMEKFKISLTLKYIKESRVSCTELYNKVVRVADEAKKCYADNSTDNFDDVEFARMMFLDGCFLLEFIYCIVYNKHGEMKMKSHDTAFVRRDLFLLENQIPFVVLKALMCPRFKDGDCEDMICTFIKRSRPQPVPEPVQVSNCIERLKNFVSSPDKPKQKVEKNLNQPVHLLELIRFEVIDVKAFDEGGCYLKGEWNSYRSAMELKKVGIHFQPGKSTRFSDITFEYTGLSSVLTLPPITIDDSTKSMLLNLVAYEACPDTPDDFGVTSYICFMDSIIDHIEDVKELRSKGILQNFSGSDEEVADLFNEIARDLVPNPHGFSQVKWRIEGHYRNKKKVWVAEWKHTHFSSPWTVIAFFAGIFVISLTVIQTVLTAIQTHLAAHPPQG